jgi:ABC-type branched-subunit amino acid transport system substrate-binding protein
MRTRFVARTLIVGTALAVALAACGNSSSSKPQSTGGTSAATASQQSLTEDDPVIAPGVSGSAIQVATITSKTNILGGNYGDFVYGVQAYFDYQNAIGGIYGRKLKIVNNRDDKLSQNQQQISASLANDNAFATFVATPLLSAPGVDQLEQHHQPTFIWNANPEMSGHDNVFGTVGAICFGCYGPGDPMLAQRQHFTKVAVLGYGVSAASKRCADGVRASFEKYPSAKVVFFDNALEAAQADLSSDVSQLKAAGAQLIFTCIDTRESVILGKELEKQQSRAVQLLPNSYDRDFVAANRQYLEGDFVATQIAAFEYTPIVPEEQTMMTWLHHAKLPVDELSSEGWVAANEFVTGLELAGPHFNQQNVISALNTDTHYDADGMIVPIDWTRQHNDPAGPNGTVNPAYAGHYNCSSVVRIHDGKFVTFPAVPAGKQWSCLPTGQPPTLPRSPTYMTFVPGAG